MNILGIDIGGSAVKGAPVDTGTGRLLDERFRVETPIQLTPRAMARTVAEVATHFRWRGPIGVGFPGVVEGTTLRTAANLHSGFIGCDAARLFREATGCRVGVVNDADAAGLAEMRFGAGRRSKGAVLLLTLGTGVGSALFCDGVLWPNSELGHLPYKGRSFEKHVAASARKRNDLTWEEWSGRLNGYLQVLETVLVPGLIIIGGGVSAKHEKYFPFLKTRAKIMPARMGNTAGIVGAALHAVE
ncbi:MAG: ROK family protein [Verrucomicrobiota bacterium]